LRHEAEEIDQDFDLLRSHLPLPLVVLNILDFLADTLEVSFTHSSVQNQAGSNWLACNSLCFLNPIAPAIGRALILARPPSHLFYSKIIRFFCVFARMPQKSLKEAKAEYARLP